MKQAYLHYFAIMGARFIKLALVVLIGFTILSLMTGNAITKETTSSDNNSAKPTATATAQGFDDTFEKDNPDAINNSLRSVSEDTLDVIINNGITSYDELKDYTDRSPDELKQVLDSHRIGFDPSSSIIKITNDEDDYCDIDLDTWEILGCTA